MESSKKQMKAVKCKQPGGPENLYVGHVDLPDLAPDGSELLIKVMATAVNRADTLQRKGGYPAPPGVTEVLGLECAGYVMEGETEGKRVMALLSGGGYAQYAKVYRDHVIEIPKEWSFEQAAAVPEVWLTAYQLLHFVAKVQPGETVLIHAAASGVGTALIQLCKKHCLKVIAVASTSAKLQICQELGADWVIPYEDEPDFSAEVMKATEKQGVDVILDPVMASNFQHNLSSISQDGRWVVYGFLGGSKFDHFDFAKLLSKRIHLLFSTLRSRTNSYKSNLVSAFWQDCKEDFEKGVLKPIVDKEFSMSQAGDAHVYLESNSSVGKVVLKQDLENDS